ncbi:MAG: methyltransferase domain-containing protein [Candidatus Cloacimonadales bacterium]
MDNIAKILARLKPEKILDIACGQGEFVAWILHYFPDFQQLLAVDNNAKMLQRAQQKFASEQRIDFRSMDAYDLALADDSYDLVTLSNSLHHFEDHSQLFAEIKRVLQPEGRLIINEMLADKLSAAQESHKKIHHFAAKIDRLKRRYHAETFSQEQVSKLMQAHGFSLEQQVDYAHEIDTELASQQVERLQDALKQMLKSVESRADFAELQAEANEISQWMQKHSFASARSLLLIAKQKKS